MDWNQLSQSFHSNYMASYIVEPQGVERRRTSNAFVLNLEHDGTLTITRKD
jgi:hypothetical protein